MSDRVFVGTHKGLFTIDRKAPGWTISDVAFLGDPVTVIQSDAASGRVWAGMDLGHFGVKMRRSTDGGATWDEVAAPAYPPKPEGLEDKDGWGREIDWVVKKIWALSLGGKDEPNVLWAGSIPGALFRSEDGGESWEMIRSLWDNPLRHEWMGGGAEWPGIHSVCVDPRDSRHVTLGVSSGGVWVTEDGGATWDCRATGMRYNFMPDEAQNTNPNTQDPHCVVQSPTSPDVFWAQHHCGIFRTTNNCASWEEIPEAGPSTFGFAVAVHPHDADTAWFVPAIKDEKRVPVKGELVATRTRDGGKSFDVLRKGLPQSQAYDLIYRHGLDVDETGDRLAFGSTTGGLWVSEDQGDSWQCVSNHLPPINAVRFAK